MSSAGVEGAADLYQGRLSYAFKRPLDGQSATSYDGEGMVTETLTLIVNEHQSSLRSAIIT